MEFYGIDFTLRAGAWNLFKCWLHCLVRQHCKVEMFLWTDLDPKRILIYRLQCNDCKIIFYEEWKTKE